jgi:hypothetical protein
MRSSLPVFVAGFCLLHADLSMDFSATWWNNVSVSDCTLRTVIPKNSRKEP